MYLAKHSSFDHKIDIKTLAYNLNFPVPFLAKIMQLMVRKGFIFSSKGPQGGFYTNEKILNTSLMDIILANERAEFFNTCGLGLHTCDCTNPCPIHNQYYPIISSYRNLLSASTINNLINNKQTQNLFNRHKKNNCSPKPDPTQPIE